MSSQAFLVHVNVERLFMDVLDGPSHGLNRTADGKRMETVGVDLIVIEYLIPEYQS